MFPIFLTPFCFIFKAIVYAVYDLQPSFSNFGYGFGYGQWPKKPKFSYLWLRLQPKISPTVVHWIHGFYNTKLVPHNYPCVESNPYLLLK